MGSSLDVCMNTEGRICPFWFVCCQAEFVYVQSLLLCASLMTPISEVGLSCLIVILLRAFPPGMSTSAVSDTLISSR